MTVLPDRSPITRCLENFPSMIVERHNKPEIEIMYVSSWAQGCCPPPPFARPLSPCSPRWRVVQSCVARPFTGSETDPRYAVYGDVAPVPALREPTLC